MLEESSTKCEIKRFFCKNNEYNRRKEAHMQSSVDGLSKNLEYSAPLAIVSLEGELSTILSNSK